MSLGFVDKRRGGNLRAAGVTTPANYVTEAAIDARLTAINAAYWTATRLAQSTRNDKIYALRLADDAAGI